MIDVRKGESLTSKSPQSRTNFQPSLKQVNFCDKRVYCREEGMYYPSVTSILEYMPPDPFLLDYMKMMGKNMDILRDRAATEGTQVHEAIEKLLSGEKIEWQDDWGNARYNLKVWQMILKFSDFYKTYSPTTIASEMFVYSDTLKYAGTADYVCELDGDVWLIDFKTSTTLSESYKLQLAAYSHALKECKGIEVAKAGILWLKAATRKRSNKKGVYQGEGWQIVENTEMEKSFRTFNLVREMYNVYNPVVEPYTKSYPTEISLN